MSELDQLTAIIQEDAADRTIVLIATYPRESGMRLLEEQGCIIEQMNTNAMNLLPDVKTFRVLWTQIVFLLSSINLNHIQIKIQELLSMTKDKSIEIRAIIIPMQGSCSLEILDTIFGEISSKKNFGYQYDNTATRIIDGKVWEVD